MCQVTTAKKTARGGATRCPAAGAARGRATITVDIVDVASVGAAGASADGDSGRDRE